MGEVCENAPSSTMMLAAKATFIPNIFTSVENI